MDLNLKKSELQNNEKKTLPNEFYCPDLFKILTERLYLLPLWSGLIIHNEIKHYKVNTRLSNNPAENWFEQVKYKVIKRKKVSTSEMVTPIYKRIFVKYINTFYEEKKLQDQYKDAKSDKYNEALRSTIKLYLNSLTGKLV